MRVKPLLYPCQLLFATSGASVQLLGGENKDRHEISNFTALVKRRLCLNPY